MKILIAVPTFENIYPDTFKSVYELDKAGCDTSFEFVRGYDCATARNRIAQIAIDRGADYALMVDNDVVLPKDALINMLDDKRDVCLGFYAHRDADNVYFVSPSSANIVKIPSDASQNGRHLTLVYSAAGGQPIYGYTKIGMDSVTARFYEDGIEKRYLVIYILIDMSVVLTEKFYHK